MKFKIFFLLILLAAFSGCRTKKTLMHKKVQEVSELNLANVKSSRDIENNISTYRITEDQDFTITPVDNEQEVKIISGKDTLQFKNAKVDFRSSLEKEKTTDRSTSKENKTDRSVSEKDSYLKEKDREGETKGTSPALIWGLILAGLALVIMGYFRKSLPFL